MPRLDRRSRDFNLRTGANYYDVIAALDPRAAKVGLRLTF